jgi:hypothetical protein
MDRVKCTTCSKVMYQDECGWGATGPACARCLLPHLFTPQVVE